jgi:hypothetical protein
VSFPLVIHNRTPFPANADDCHECTEATLRGVDAAQEERQVEEANAREEKRARVAGAADARYFERRLHPPQHRR